MNRPSIGAQWSNYGQDWRAKRDQLLGFADALRPLHPLLEHFSDRGRRSSWQGMLKEPLLQDMTDAQIRIAPKP